MSTLCKQCASRQARTFPPGMCWRRVPHDPTPLGTLTLADSTPEWHPTHCQGRKCALRLHRKGLWKLWPASLGLAQAPLPRDSPLCPVTEVNHSTNTTKHGGLPVDHQTRGNLANPNTVTKMKRRQDLPKDHRKLSKIQKLARRPRHFPGGISSPGRLSDSAGASLSISLEGERGERFWCKRQPGHL